MTIDQKGKLISAILTHLEFAAKNQNKAFDRGDTFFMLAFRTDSQLKKIAKLAGI